MATLTNDGIHAYTIMKEAQPCPWCKNNPELRHQYEPHLGTDGWSIVCPSSMCGAGTGPYRSAAEAWEAWAKLGHEAWNEDTTHGQCAEPKVKSEEFPVEHPVAGSTTGGLLDDAYAAHQDEIKTIDRQLRAIEQELLYEEFGRKCHCGNPTRDDTQRYCKACHAEYMRIWRRGKANEAYRLKQQIKALSERIVELENADTEDFDDSGE